MLGAVLEILFVLQLTNQLPLNKTTLEVLFDCWDGLKCKDECSKGELTII